MKDAPLDISSPEMTARLEQRMDAIGEGEVRREDVVAESQVMLEEALRRLEGHTDEIRDRIKAGAREDRGDGLIVGTCLSCGGQLKVILNGKTGKRFVACSGKPGEVVEPAVDAEGKVVRPGCGQTFPLPQRGAIVATEKNCPECGWPEIKVTGGGGRGRPWVLCLDIDCPSKEKYKARKQKTS